MSARAAPSLPDLRQDVVLALPGALEYRARVTKLTDDEIVLVLMFDARDPLSPGDVVAAAVEFPGPRGLVRLEGHGTVATSDLIRFRVDGAGDILQRRDFVRVSVVRPLALAHVRADGSHGPWVETFTVNVSGNGLLVAAAEALDVGDPLGFRLTLEAGAPPVEGVGRVARIGEDGQRGVAIDTLEGDGRRRLVKFIFECERISRQRTRDGEL